MSTLAKTPDDKMHRYLQRIQKLVGHRGKSPLLMKSRIKSPINIKTSRIDNYLKHEMFFKSIFTVWDEHHTKIKTQFFNNFLEANEIRQTKRRDSYYSSQNYNKTARKQNTQPLAVRFIIKAMKNSINRLFRPAFQSIKIYQREIQARDTNRTRQHRRTYSEIYAQSVSKYHSKSPSTIRNYEFKTPQIHKKQSRKQQKQAQSRLIVSAIQKVSYRMRLNAFSSLKSFYCKYLTLKIQQSQNSSIQIQQQFSALKKQYQKITLQLKKANSTITQQQKLYQPNIANRSKQHQNNHNVQIMQLERVIHQTNAIFCIIEIINKKMTCDKALSLQKIKAIKSTIVNEYAKCLALSNTLKMLINTRKKDVFVNFIHKKPNTMNPSESRQAIIQRTYTPSQVVIQSLYSSKKSLSSQKSAASNFDIYSKKINSAFEMKSSLTQIYAYGFQKIDESAYIYMTIANPINKVIKLTLTQTFRKLLFYSFSKSQQKSSKQQNQEKIFPNKPSSITLVESVPKKNYGKIFSILKKIERKILFMKIQAYRQFFIKSSILKLTSDLNKTYRMPNDLIISQVELKRQITDFLQQRNTMHSKTYDTWQKTKQMLQQVKHSQSRSSFSSRPNS